MNDDTIMINDVPYKLGDLPIDIQDLLTIRNVWETELKSKRIEVFKHEAAIRGLDGELEIRFKNFSDKQ